MVRIIGGSARIPDSGKEVGSRVDSGAVLVVQDNVARLQAGDDRCGAPQAAFSTLEAEGHESR
jgi:hypothetical protein